MSIICIGQCAYDLTFPIQEPLIENLLYWRTGGKCGIFMCPMECRNRIDFQMWQRFLRCGNPKSFKGSRG